MSPRLVRVALLRHGEAAAGDRCAGRRFDPPLTLSGHREAQAAVARLDEVLGGPPDRVVCSPAARARETAAAWTDTPTVEPRLAERDWGAWEGRPWAELWTAMPWVANDMEAYLAFCPPAGETVDAVSARVRRALADLANEGRGETVIAVTHGGPLRLAVAEALGLRPAAAFGMPAPTGRAAVVVARESGWQLELVGG